MRKTTLELDEGLFERARQVLETRGLKAAVQRAFEEVLGLDARKCAIRHLEELDWLGRPGLPVGGTAQLRAG
jgi:hypothetical protein